MLVFDRPVGVHRDTAELEFILALMQTNQKVMRNSIKTEDLVLYLKSRHGVNVSEAEAQDLITNQMAGQVCDDGNHDVLDICQLLGILLMPRLLEAAVKDDERIFAGFQEEIATESKHGSISKDGLRLLFAKCGEENIDEGLLDEMVALGEKGLVAALTSDLGLFDLAWPTRTSTNYDDVCTLEHEPEPVETEITVKEAGKVLRSMFSTSTGAADTIDNKVEKAPDSQEPAPKTLGNSFFKREQELKENYMQSLDKDFQNVNLIEYAALPRAGTAPTIDYTADGFGRPLFIMVLWSAGIASHFAYVLKEANDGEWMSTKCIDDGYGCTIAAGILRWLAIFFQLVLLGLPYIILGSLGNSIYSRHKIVNLAALCVGIATVAMFTVVPFFKEYTTVMFDTSGNKDLTAVKLCNGDLECLELCELFPEECEEEYKTKEDVLGVTFYLSLLLGLGLIMSQIVDICLLFVPKVWIRGRRWVNGLVTPAGIRQEAANKKAASKKTTDMLDNALDIRDNNAVPSSFSKSNRQSLAHKLKGKASTLERFLLLPKQTETVGGIVWAWKKIFNGSMFAEEGIWLYGRLLACNFAQLIVVAVIIFFTRYMYNLQSDFFYSNEETKYKEYIDDISLVVYGNYTEEFETSFGSFVNCSEVLLNMSFTTLSEESFVDYTEPVNYASFMISAFGSLAEALNFLQPCVEANPEVASFLNQTELVLAYQPDSIKDLITNFNISGAQYLAAAWMGLFAGLASALYVAIVFIPSYVSTVLKYRSGVIPSLDCRDFLRYRTALDTVTVLLGSSFWGTFFSATAAMILMVACLLFIGLVPLFLGAAFGFVIILGMKMAVMIFLRCTNFSAYYRKRPVSANITFIVLEVWNVGLSVGFITVRAVKLIVISALFIARIDTPVLAPGVGRVFGVELDGSWFAFHKDILMHEAHRHVLIERFGLLCLLKLRGGDKFATRAGSAWRLLYVMLMLPWLRKYRVCSSADDALDENIAEIEHDLEEEADEEERSALTKQLLAAKAEKRAKKRAKQPLLPVKPIEEEGPFENAEEEVKMLKKRNLYLEERLKEVHGRLVNREKSESFAHI